MTAYARRVWAGDGSRWEQGVCSTQGLFVLFLARLGEARDTKIVQMGCKRNGGGLGLDELFTGPRTIYSNVVIQ